MTWTYQQSKGELIDPAGEWIGTGYSGRGMGRNNPALQRVADVGPIPRGKWKIGPPLDPPDHLGPVALPLMPEEGTETFGRSGFFMHGDNAKHDESASHGCIVVTLFVRRTVAASDDHGLEVVA